MTSKPSHHYRHFQLERDRDDIVWLTFDMAHSPVNRLSTQVMEELDQIFDTLASQPPAGLIIQSGKRTGFCAGADINEFAGLDSADKTLALVARGWKLFNRIAGLPYPTLALIDGHCLGGGTELALACRYRLALDSQHTRMALPEVRLGIFPAWGGILRLPRLIGPQQALNLMLTGRSVRANRAARLGLVDAVVPSRVVQQAAASQVLSNTPARRARGLQRWLNHPWLKPIVAQQARKSINQQDPHHHYNAPRAVLKLWQKHDGRVLRSPDDIEALTQSSTTRNLIRVFGLQERLRSLGRQTDAARLQRIHVVGAGTMGAGIAAWCAAQGLRVTLQDIDRERIAHAQGLAMPILERRLRSRQLVQAAFDRLIPDPDGHGVRHADLVIEAISENLEHKLALFRTLEPHMRADAILASNTSSLSLTSLAESLARQERFVGMHFFNPVAAMPLIEVIETPLQARWAYQKALGFVTQIGKLPLPVQDSPGFLVNAVLAPYLLEAMRGVDEGMSPASIDLAMEKFGMPMGPLEMADVVGLDIIRDAGNQLGMNYSLPACLQACVDQEHFGKKSGQGFYTWKDGQPEKGLPASPSDDLARRLLAPMIKQATACVRTGVVADDDLADAGMIFGAGFAPFTGGPLTWQREHPE